MSSTISPAATTFSVFQFVYGREVSDYNNDADTETYNWTFSTIRTPFGINGFHPVSGHRQFGLVKDPETGNWTFYARGFDRVSDPWIPFVDDNKIVFGGGDALWNCLIGNVAEFFGKEPNEPIRHRPDWEYVKNFILSLEPSEILKCDNND